MFHNQKKALITGVNGQSGPYLAQLLLSKGYIVYGMIRQSSKDNLDFISEFNLHDMIIVHGDLTDESSLFKLINDIKPDEIYNLGAVSHPGMSFEQPELTIQVNGLSVLKILEIIKSISPKTRLCQIGTADMLADARISPQDEQTPLCPLSPYGAAKCLAHNSVTIYRKSYGIYGSNIIAYGHDSPRRSLNFVTRKVTNYAVRYSKGLCKTALMLGNLDSRRDWGDVPSYVEGMYASLQPDKPDDYILSTGITHSIKDLCQLAFKYVGIDIIFEGEGIETKGINIKNGEQIIYSCKDFYRPSEPFFLVGNSQKAYNILGWKPKKTFEETIKWMVESENVHS